MQKAAPVKYTDPPHHLPAALYHSLAHSSIQANLQTGTLGKKCFLSLIIHVIKGYNVVYSHWAYVSGKYSKTHK